MMKNDGLLSPILRRWRTTVVGKYLIKLRDKKILSFGCGDGRMLDFLDKSNRYCGVDRNLENVPFQKRRLKRAKFFRLDLASEINKIRGTFDVVLAIAVLEHLDLNDNLVEEIIKKIKKNGYLYVTTPSPLAKGIHDFGSKFWLFNRVDNKEHKRLLSKEKLVQIFKKLELVKYQKFEFGLNQLFIFRKI